MCDAVQSAGILVFLKRIRSHLKYQFNPSLYRLLTSPSGIMKLFTFIFLISSLILLSLAASVTKQTGERRLSENSRNDNLTKVLANQKGEISEVTRLKPKTETTKINKKDEPRREPPTKHGEEEKDKLRPEDDSEIENVEREKKSCKTLKTPPSPPTKICLEVASPPSEIEVCQDDPPPLPAQLPPQLTPSSPPQFEQQQPPPPSSPQLVYEPQPVFQTPTEPQVIYQVAPPSPPQTICFETAPSPPQVIQTRPQNQQPSLVQLLPQFSCPPLFQFPSIPQPPSLPQFQPPCPPQFQPILQPPTIMGDVHAYHKQFHRLFHQLPHLHHQALYHTPVAYQMGPTSMAQYAAYSAPYSTPYQGGSYMLQNNISPMSGTFGTPIMESDAPIIDGFARNQGNVVNQSTMSQPFTIRQKSMSLRQPITLPNQPPHLTRILDNALRPGLRFTRGPNQEAEDNTEENIKSSAAQNGDHQPIIKIMSNQSSSPKFLKFNADSTSGPTLFTSNGLFSEASDFEDSRNVRNVEKQSSSIQPAGELKKSSKDANLIPNESFDDIDDN